MKLASFFVAGFLFAIGLVVGGMTQPKKIINFLDVGGDWDPSLAFVMLGAVGVHSLTYRLTMRRSSPLFAAKFLVPQRSDIDARLVLGGVIFGAGWGLGGYCPGPALVAGGALVQEALLFIGMTVIGHWVFGRYDAWARQRAVEASTPKENRAPVGGT